MIDLALENKMSWNALAYLLKDITSYDAEAVVVSLLKALEKLHFKTQEKDFEVSLPNSECLGDVEEEGNQ